jgi:hypothetical protein
LPQGPDLFDSIETSKEGKGNGFRQSHHRSGPQDAGRSANARKGISPVHRRHRELVAAGQSFGRPGQGRDRDHGRTRRRAVYERAGNGGTADWGEVRVWDPPRRLVYSWHPGRQAGTAQEVELRFTGEGNKTRVELEHRGWDALDEKASAMRDNYDTGWNHVLGECYGKAAGVT